jgi:NAD(P)-dependent dehydrogenase (short-subunit alcohol dehydrogenase family)
MILNAVAPGVMKTPVLAPETHEFLAELHPVGRMREIQDIVDAILFLENAAIITGRDSVSSTMARVPVIARMERRPGPLLLQSSQLSTTKPAGDVRCRT